MFDSYLKKLNAIQANTPKIYKTVALKGAKFAENTAKQITDQEKLVDTGNYRRNWNAERIEPEKGTYGIVLENSADYASHLEQGHKIKGGGRYKGKFVGRRTLDDTHFYCLEQLDKAFEKAYTKHQQSFTEPQD